jgi:hypothetical protein
MFARHMGRFTTSLLLVAAALGICVGATALALPLFSQGSRVVPITDPTQLPRLSFERLRYAGAFRLPGGSNNGDTFSAGGGPLAFNPARNSLFVGARSGRVAEITVPSPVNSREVAALPVAEFVQPFEEPSEGGIKDIAKDGANLSGLMVYRGRLYGTGLIYYDANNVQRRSHFSRPLALNARGATPLRAVWDDRRTGFVAGYLALVPPEWQTRLGGPAITGQCCLPIISRTSVGPAAFAFDPADLDDERTVSARPLLYYPTDHPSLGPWSGSNPTYGATTEIGGLAVIAGTRTALFVGRNGTGPYCYGIGTANRALDQTTNDKNEKFCYDPTTADKGQHAYPYRYQMWAYDLGEWAEVRAGRRDPWSVKPYAVWPFELPTPETNSVRIIGVAYDAATQRLFISQRSADRDTYASRALIHVYQLP